MQGKSPQLNDPRARRWHQLLTRDARFQVRSVGIAKSNIFADQEIHFPRVVAVIGHHGSGKSSLLRAIEGVFGRSAPAYSPPFLRGNTRTSSLNEQDSDTLTGEFTVELGCPAGTIIRTVDLKSDPRARYEMWAREIANFQGAAYANPTTAFMDIDYMFQNYMPGREHEGEWERRATNSELAALKNIVGRSYDYVNYRFVQVDRFEDGPLYSLFVEAKNGSRVLNSVTMSQGELWVHYVLNEFIGYNSEPGDVLLLDEPETFLAEAAQRSFLDQVAQRVLRNESQLMIGTHSYRMLNRFPLENIRLCVRIDERVEVIQPSSFAQIKDAVGINSPVRSIILVEDSFAADVLLQLFSIYDIELTRDVEIVAAGGEASVLSGVRALSNAKRIPCIGVLDGDQRIKATSGTSIKYLPGSDGPETELLRVASRSSEVLARKMNRPRSDIIAALGNCTRLDHQYQMQSLASQLGVQHSIIASFLVSAWLQDRNIENEAQTLIAEIRTITGYH